MQQSVLSQFIRNYFLLIDLQLIILFLTCSLLLSTSRLFCVTKKLLFNHRRRSCEILQYLIWVKLPVSQLQGDAHGAQWIEKKSHYRTLKYLSDRRWWHLPSYADMPSRDGNQGQLNSLPRFLVQWNSSCHKTTNTRRTTELCIKTVPFWRRFKSSQPQADPSLLSMEASVLGRKCVVTAEW